MLAVDISVVVCPVSSINMYKSLSTYPLPNSIPYLQLSSNPSTLLHRQLLTIQPPGLLAHHHNVSLSRSPVSSSVKFCIRSLVYAALSIKDFSWVIYFHTSYRLLPENMACRGVLQCVYCMMHKCTTEEKLRKLCKNT